MTETLLIVGGGPKAAAVCAKCSVLRQLRIPAPNVTLFERDDLAAAWTGKYGFTTGDLRLGTPPEKDIGFPYFPDPGDPQVTAELFGQFSWLSYLALQKKGMAEWIDRGRPGPTHRAWAQYIKWVIKKSLAPEHCKWIRGDVLKIHPQNRGWKIVARCNNRRKEFFGDSLLITGSGEAKKPNFDLPPTDRKILYGDNFWMEIDSLNNIDKGDDVPPIIIVGGGETAASIAAYLVDHFGPDPVPIVIVTRKGTIYTRGESYYENRIFTHHDGWTSFDEDVRLETILRGDRGVFSVDLIEKLAQAPNVEHRFLEVKKVEIADKRTELLEINDGIECQLLIFAMGFDPLSFTKMIADEDVAKTLRKPSDKSRRIYEIERTIEYDLSVNQNIISSKLYLPMLSGLAQGPGFPNLSCLGLLSDRILHRITPPPK
jgi:mycobactin lysine-N-oxygenase